jgi:hypothetical protein
MNTSILVLLLALALALAPSAGHAAAGNAPAAVSSTLLSAVTNAVRIGPGVPVIIETDMGTDCDDAVDLTFAHRLMDLGAINILAVVTPITNWWSGAAIHAINTYNGRGDIPIGVMKTRPDVWIPDWPDNYGSALATNFPHAFNGNTNCEDAVQLCRKIFAASPDQSITWVSLSPPGDIFVLFVQDADWISPLHSKDLFNLKVKDFVSVLGDMPSGYEFDVYKYPYYGTNIYGMTNRLTFVPGRLPATYYTMAGYSNVVTRDNPLHMAVSLGLVALGDGSVSRPAWGQLCLLYAAYGLSTNFTAVTTGTNLIDIPSGSNYWQGTTIRNQQYLQSAGNSNAVVALINSNLFSKPLLSGANGLYESVGAQAASYGGVNPLAQRIYFGPTNSPAFAPPNGSLYLSGQGTLYLRTNGAWIIK